MTRLTLVVLNLLWETKIVFIILTPKGPSIRNTSSCKTRIYSFSIINTLPIADLASCVAKVSPSMALIYLSINNPVLAPAQLKEKLWHVHHQYWPCYTPPLPCQTYIDKIMICLRQKTGDNRNMRNSGIYSSYTIDVLSVCGLVKPYDVRDLGQYWHR